MLFSLKNIFQLLLALSVAGVGDQAFAQAPPPAAPVTYQTFYDALSPYGQWVDDPDYGYAWVPTAGPDFQPYRTNGHWVYTDYGWTWVSDYQWGWAAFHYGRWRYSDASGWLWVPGYSWGPAWVAWRQSAGYYGWAPLGPPPPRAGVHVSIGFSFSFGDAPVAPARWCFVPAAYVASPAIATYYVAPAQTTVVYNNTTIIHNTYVNNSVTNVSNTNVSNATVVNQRNRNTFNQGGGIGQPAFPAGPARADVEKATGQPITPLAVSNRAKPGVGVQGKSLAFYRPEIAAPTPPSPRRNDAGVDPAASPAPQKVVPLAQAASQTRRLPADPNRGLLRDNAARHLSSTDADPIRVAKQQAQAAAPAGGPGPAPAGPRVAIPTRPDRPLDAATADNRQPFKAQPRDQAQPASALAAPTSRPTPPDNDQRQQVRQQAQAARQQQHDQQQQAKEQKQQAKQQEQQARQQAQQAHQQAKQAQQQAKLAQQQARQQRPARSPQARPPHPEGREEHR